MLLTEVVNQQLHEHAFVDSAKREAAMYASQLGTGIPAIFCSDKLYNDNFEVTNKGFAVRGAIPVVVTRFEEVNHVGSEKPNEFGFVTDLYHDPALHLLPPGSGVYPPILRGGSQRIPICRKAICPGAGTVPEGL